MLNYKNVYGLKIEETVPWRCKFETPLENGRHEACFRACVRAYTRGSGQEYERTEDERARG